MPKSANARVFIVDDDEAVRDSLEALLQTRGFEVRAFESAPKLLAAIDKSTRGCVLTDVRMPDIDGLTMLKFYRANPATREIPTIVLSTKEDPKVKAESFTLGASDYLVKLPDPIELSARVRLHSRG